jgi:hypothetical protein
VPIVSIQMTLIAAYMAKLVAERTNELLPICGGMGERSQTDHPGSGVD